jgi:hypothetical protein
VVQVRVRLDGIGGMAVALDEPVCSDRVEVRVRLHGTGGTVVVRDDPVYSGHVGSQKGAFAGVRGRS